MAARPTVPFTIRSRAGVSPPCGVGITCDDSILPVGLYSWRFWVLVTSMLPAVGTTRASSSSTSRRADRRDGRGRNKFDQERIGGLPFPGPAGWRRGGRSLTAVRESTELWLSSELPS